MISTSEHIQVKEATFLTSGVKGKQTVPRAETNGGINVKVQRKDPLAGLPPALMADVPEELMAPWFSYVVLCEDGTECEAKEADLHRILAGKKEDSSDKKGEDLDRKDSQ